MKNLRLDPDIHHQQSIVKVPFSFDIELIILWLQNIVWEKGYLFVGGGIGKKDRISLLSENIGLMLKKYIQRHMPNYFLVASPFDSLRFKNNDTIFFSCQNKKAKQHLKAN
ncbi:MAG: hypothetical protein L7U68_01370 [Flavobacteriaceae bacterium]|nr:hypothetical protein [Flavobacteriaceae bacterium]